MTSKAISIGERIVRFKPRLEITNADTVLDFGLLERNRDWCLATPDAADPLGIPEGRQAARDSLVEALCVDLDRVLDTVNITTSYSAGPNRHSINVNIYSSFIRLTRAMPNIDNLCLNNLLPLLIRLDDVTCRRFVTQP